MSNKIIIAILSILGVFFLTAQTCSLPTTSTGLAADCIGEGDIICDNTEAYECGLAAYGTGYYVSRSSENDAEYCGAVEAFDEESLARALLSLSSDLENKIDDLSDLKLQERNAEEDGDERVLVVIRAELGETRTALAEIRTVFEDVTTAVADANAAGEDVTSLETLVADVETELTVAEDLLLEVSTQVTEALVALGGTTTDADSDEMPDDWETSYGLDTADASDAADDTDGDGLTNLEEYTTGTNPTLADTDGDSCTDYDELYTYSTDATTAGDCSASTDTDGDGLTDDEEATYGTDANDTDTDDDGMSDYVEVAETGTDPLDADMDNDGIDDTVEVEASLDPATDELNAYAILNFDIDSHDWTPYDTDDDGGDGYTDYYGTSSSGATINGDVRHTIETGEENYIVDLTSSTTDDYIYFDASTVHSNVEDWVVMKVRVKPEATTGMQPLVVHATTTCYQPQYMLNLYNDEYRLNMNVAGTMESVSGGTATSGAWQEIVAVYKDNKLYLFVDGTLVDSKTITDAFSKATTDAFLTPSTKGLSVGYSDATLGCATEYDFEGYIDTIQIWGD